MAKETRELYRGPAKITGIGIEGVEDWRDWEKAKLNAADAVSAFKLTYDVEQCDETKARRTVKIEVSHRELAGKMLEFYRREDGVPPTQMDVAIKSLVGQELLKRGSTEADIAWAADEAHVGREVCIRVYEEKKDDGSGWWLPKAAFCSKYARLTGEAMRDRIAAFVRGKPSPKRKTAAPKVEVKPVAAPEDLDDLPF